MEEKGVILPTQQSIQSLRSMRLGLRDEVSQFRNHFTEYCFYMILYAFT